MEKEIRILFIGNSHTYFNDMPAIAADKIKKAGYGCEVTMIAHGGWYLEQHVQEPDVRFNILYGHYDYVVLQEHSHPFAAEKKFFEAVRKLNQWIREAGSIPIIYMTWAKEDEPEKQEYMTEVHKRIAEEIDALLAPAGEYWQQYKEEHPEIEMYYEDGAHASKKGSEFAADHIVKVILQDRKR